MFRITRGKGFHITFANGWTISVQFGNGNYCDNYDFRGTSVESGEKGSSDAEVATISPSGDLFPCPLFESGDTVEGQCSPEKVAALIAWTIAQ